MVPHNAITTRLSSGCLMRPRRGLGSGRALKNTRMLFWERREDIVIFSSVNVDNTTPIFRLVPCFFQCLPENYGEFNAWALGARPKVYSPPGTQPSCPVATGPATRTSGRWLA